MKTGIIVYAFNLAGDLHRLLNHIMTETDAEIYLFLHSQNSLVVKTCEDFACHLRVHYFPYGINRGLARSANEAFIQGYCKDSMDVMMTSNDDLLPAPGDIMKIARVAFENRDKFIVTGMGVVGGRHENVDISMSAINPIAFQTIGYFDQNFFPAYHEDVDWLRRAWLAGLQRMCVQDTNIIHVGSGSFGTVDRSLHDQQFGKNMRFYEKKWGGNVGQETFTVPFDDPAVGLKIPAECVNNPYPGRNRGGFDVNLSREQVQDFKAKWDKRVDELIQEFYYTKPSEPLIPYNEASLSFEIAFPDYFVAVDSDLTVERANLARYFGWAVIWIDPEQVDMWDVVREVAGEIVPKLTQRVL